MKALARRITIVDTPIEAEAKVDELLKTDGIKSIAFLNAHACLMTRKNAAFAAELKAADLLFRDGIGVKIMLRYLGIPAGYNANGTDLIPKLLTANKHKRILCIGTQEPFISEGVTKMRHDGIHIISYMDGFQSNEAMLAEITRTSPDVVLLGMGMPKQELFCNYVKVSGYDNPLLMICGGAIIDFYAGRFARAPAIFRNNGLEWLYRLFAEPRRLFKRYVIGIPYFLMVLLLRE